MGIRERLKVSKKLDPFLKGVWLPSFRLSCKRELIDHVVLLMKDNPYLTEDNAIKELGDHTSVSSDFRKLQRKLLGKSLFNISAGSILGFTTLLVLSATIFLYTFDFNDLSPNKSLDEYVRLIIEDQNHLAKYSIFTEGSQEHDAGELLNPLIEREYCRLDQKCESNVVKNHPSFTALEKYFPINGRGSSEEREEWLLQLRKLNKFESSRAILVDTSLLKELLRYDHWDLYKTSEFHQAQLKKFSRDQIAISSTEPSNLNLRTLVKVRFNQARVRGDHLQALKESRHLSKLLLSTEAYFNYSISVVETLLRLEHAYVKSLPANEQKRIMIHWSLIKEKDLLSISGLYHAQKELLSLGTDFKTLKLVFPLGRDIPMLCNSLKGALAMYPIYKRVYSSVINTRNRNRDFVEQHNLFLEEASKRCRLSFSRENIRYISKIDFSKSFREEIERIEGKFAQFLAYGLSHFEFGISTGFAFVKRYFSDSGYAIGSVYSRRLAKDQKSN